MAPKGRSRPILPTVNDSHEVEAPHAETEEDMWKRIAAKRRLALCGIILCGNLVPPGLEEEVPDPSERMAKRKWETSLLSFKAKLSGHPSGHQARQDQTKPQEAIQAQGQGRPATSSASCGPPGTWIAAAPTTSSASCGPPGTGIAAGPTTSATADETGSLNHTWIETTLESP